MSKSWILFSINLLNKNLIQEHKISDLVDLV